jgi:starch-binding outer membrane protein, SusD/RagB family
MKKIKYISSAFLAVALLGASSCNKALDIEPTNKLQVESVFSNPAGVKLYIANLYWQMPVEDFTYFNNGFNRNEPGPNNGGQNRAMSTDEAVHSENGGISLPAQWWAEGYTLIRDVNILIDAVPNLDIQQTEKDKIIGEASFIRAWAYYGLAMRYGGVPIITSTQEWAGDVNALKVQRSTEKATYDFILSELDVATEKLPDSWGGERRATKWVAYALKSRAALYAASLAKYWNKAALGGVAVDNKYVGMSASDANTYYDASIKASEAIMNSGKFSLYQATPSTPAEAAENYRKMFMDPNVASSEVMFIKGYALPLDRRGHNYDIWFTPAQLANSWPHPGRMNPTLDLVDSYEDYTDPGKAKPIATTTDGNVTDHNGYNASKDYLHFADPTELFKNKDARMHATVVVPFSTMKGTKIIIQAGYIEPNGAARIRTGGSIDVNGVKYYNYGGPTPNNYSGFDAFGGNMTKTGFSFRKFLQDATVINGWNKSTQDWAEFRYAEILLNYAEAVAESGLGDAAKAAAALNATRRRAAFMTPIPLTIENVMRERKVELAFENKRWWDLIRRREYHEMFNAQVTHALLPVLDLRQSTPSYIFIRANAPGISPRTFQIRDYYLQIPDVGASGVVQNPTG